MEKYFQHIPQIFERANISYMCLIGTWDCQKSRGTMGKEITEVQVYTNELYTCKVSSISFTIRKNTFINLHWSSNSELFLWNYLNTWHKTTELKQQGKQTLFCSVRESKNNETPMEENLVGPNNTRIYQCQYSIGEIKYGFSRSYQCAKN